MQFMPFILKLHINHMIDRLLKIPILRQWFEGLLTQNEHRAKQNRQQCHFPNSAHVLKHIPSLHTQS